MAHVSPESVDGIPPKPAPPPPLSAAPDENGRFGAYGGSTVPETLVPALQNLESSYLAATGDRRFWDELRTLLGSYVGRPTPLYEATRLTRFVRSRNPKNRGATIWLKREDLAHTGSHHINNALGQALLAKRMGKQRIIAETAAGQHGVAAATAAAHFGLACEIYMGAEDARRQQSNVARMEMLGARVVQIDSGSRTLNDALTQALRDWTDSHGSTHFLVGSVVGPHPYPAIVRDFQSIIGRETKGQALRAFGRLPHAIVASVGGGSNAAGMFYPFIDEAQVRLIGVEAGGEGDRPGAHAASLARGVPGELHGTYTYVLQDADGRTSRTHSCSAGLDFPAVGPELAYWKDAGRLTSTIATDQQAIDAFSLLTRAEGILPALETAHALAEALRLAGEMDAEHHLVVCLSGRGEKDIEEFARLTQVPRSTDQALHTQNSTG
ncbi:MAG: tryptophan synthase subunit beta [Phycisphaeraceae bacterium]|nr:tryptophan synthase subunit beta [Phycisphaeraceae bacterium]MCW5754248.1 tryptophan synthase subunit beta [Phycisphaeraceae bacterium]